MTYDCIVLIYRTQHENCKKTSCLEGIQKGYNLSVVLPAPGCNIGTLLARAFSRPLSVNQGNEVKVVLISKTKDPLSSLAHFGVGR